MTYVYRLYDTSDQLLYVGIADNVIGRLRQHQATKSWFDDISRIEYTDYISRRIAEKVERETIQTWWPVYNVMHRPSDGEVLEFLFNLHDELYDWPTNAQIYQAVREGSGDYCRAKHVEDIKWETIKLLDRLSEIHPPLRAERPYEVLLAAALAEMDSPCEGVCLCWTEVPA